MNTGWAPKPLRPEAENPLFEMVEAPIVVKGLTPIQRQRLADGTPHTVTARTALRPPDPELQLPQTMLKKGSMVEKYDERPKQIKQEPQDPMTVVKSYLAYEKKASDPDPESKEKMQAVHKSLENMKAAINDFVKKAGAELPDKDDEDEEKALAGDKPEKTSAPKQPRASVGSAVAGGARTVMGAVAGAIGRK